MNDQLFHAYDIYTFWMFFILLFIFCCCNYSFKSSITILGVHSFDTHVRLEAFDTI